MNYVHNELCRLRRRSDGYTNRWLTSYGDRKNTYLLTKSVEDVQLIPTIRCTGTLVLFVSLVW